MINDIQHHMDDYWAWLKKKTQLKEIRNSVEITTPFLDSHNDYIQIYVVKQGDLYRLTDDGCTINSLEDSGHNPKSKKCQSLLRATLNGLGVHKEAGELYVLARPDNFAQQKHNLLQAILALGSLRG